MAVARIGALALDRCPCLSSSIGSGGPADASIGAAGSLAYEQDVGVEERL